MSSFCLMHSPKRRCICVVTGDFVTTEDGTGIVHIAPSFGADDFKVARENGIGSLTLVDKQGKFIETMGEFAGRFVKTEYDPDFQAGYDESVDVDIIVKLKKENRAFKTEKYEHSYPHCWRTDKPILYYPLDSWFIRTTAYKDQMIELNKTINWKPECNRYRPVRQLAGKPGRLEPFPFPLLGNTAADLDNRGPD